MNGSILLVIGDAAEALDTFYPYYRMQEEGLVCTPVGRERRKYHLVAHCEVTDWDVTVEERSYELQAEITFSEVDSNDYIGIILTGGRAPEYLRYDPDLIAITKQMADDGKPVASICHGIEIAAAADIIVGRQVTTVAKCRFDVESAGGRYLDVPTAVDGGLVTARTYRDCGPWMREYVSALEKYVAENPT
jgi:protease I